MTIYQDGRQFYNAETDELVYEYPWPVGDGDVESATHARAAFLGAMSVRGIEVEWEA